MSPTRTIITALLFVTCAYADTVSAQEAPPSKAEQTLKFRKSVYQVMAWNFGPMAAMAQGKAPYNAPEFVLRAERVAMIAPMLKEAYTAETKGVANSRLKSAMWENRADFDSKLQALIDRSAGLATTAKLGDFDKSKAALFDTAGACKACHDEYKAD
jgi:cytochrome c556